MKENKNKLNLLYPLEMYYVDYFESFPNDEEIYHIIADYREMIANSDISKEQKKAKELSINLLTEKISQYDYFDGVRNILEQFFLGNKNPAEIFESLFPFTENQAEIFRSQFTDACDLIAAEDGLVDWPKMGVSWYDFKKEEGVL